MNIIYFHGFGSSGSTSTAKHLQKMFPEDIVISPDIPLNPVTALRFLKDLVSGYSPEETIIVGTSMGGFFAQQMNGYTRVLVNPAFHVSEIIEPEIGSTKEWFCKRKDGSLSYEITKELVDAFKEVESKQFDNLDKNSYIVGFFGDEDELVNCKDEFEKYYSNSIPFHGKHRMTKEFVNDILGPHLKQLKDSLKR